jgi:hypothetical protein
MSIPDQSATSNSATRTVHFKVITNVPEYTIRVGDQRLQFDTGGEATLDLPIDSEWIVYYDLHKTSIGQSFELRMSERQSPVRHTVETDSQNVHGFAGLDVLP